MKLPKETELLNKAISHLKIKDENFSSFSENDILENVNRNFSGEIISSLIIQQKRRGNSK
jgi:hypothetical protein